MQHEERARIAGPWEEVPVPNHSHFIRNMLGYMTQAIYILRSSMSPLNLKLLPKSLAVSSATFAFKAEKPTIPCSASYIANFFSKVLSCKQKEGWLF